MDLKFGTDGIRGPVQTEITPEVCLRIGHAAGLVLKEEGLDTVMIGKDTRVSGYMLEAALEAVNMNINKVDLQSLSGEQKVQLKGWHQGLQQASTVIRRPA